MCFKTAALAIICSSFFSKADAHSWTSQVAGGAPRGGIDVNDDLVTQRLFCPTKTLEECQLNPKHGFTLTAENQRPCRPNVQSNPWGHAEIGKPILVAWPGNGHANSQANGTCVKVMIAPYDADPDLSDFKTLESCLDYKATSGEVTIPSSYEAGKYTIFWWWHFSEFDYTSCVDVEVSAAGDSSSDETGSKDEETVADHSHGSEEGTDKAVSTTAAPTAEDGHSHNSEDSTADEDSTEKSPSAEPKSNSEEYKHEKSRRSRRRTSSKDVSQTKSDDDGAKKQVKNILKAQETKTEKEEGLTVKTYRSKGCGSVGVEEADSFCQATFHPDSYCKNWLSDPCGRSACLGGHDALIKKESC